MKIFPPIIAVVAGLLGGIFGGRQVAGHFEATPRSSPAGRKVSGEPAHGSSASARAVPMVPVDRHDIHSLLRWWLLENSGGSEECYQLDRMDSGAIRSLMTDLASTELKPGGAEQYARDTALATAAGELFRREGERALQWANAPDPASGREKILGAMIVAAATDDPALAKPWFDRYLLEFGKGRSISITGAAIRGATARGAEELVKLKEIFGSDLQTGMPAGPLPEDFNYRLFVKNFSAGEPESRTTMQQWVVKDPDAAWAAVKELSATDGSHAAIYAGSLFSGKAVGGKEKEAIRWLMPKLDELPQEFRHWALSSLFSDNWASRAVAADIMAEMLREDDRIDVADSLIGTDMDSIVSLEALGALGTEDAQVKALLKSVDHVSWNMKSPPDNETVKTLRYYSNLMDELKLSPAAREKVEATFHPKPAN